MANLKEIRNRISSVSSTMQITSAMKMVSAAKLKKAQDAITAMRPYSNKLTELLQNLSATLDADSGSKFANQREVNNVLIVAITSNRGLCGAFNSNIIKEVNALMGDTYADKNVSVLAIGKKANDAFSKTGNVIANKSEVFDDLTFDNVAEIAEMMLGVVDGDEDDWPNWFAKTGYTPVKPLNMLAYGNRARVIDLAFSGHGVALADLKLTAADVAAGHLVRLNETPMTGGRAMYLVYPETDYPDPRVTAFGDWFLSEVAAIRS